MPQSASGQGSNTAEISCEQGANVSSSTHRIERGLSSGELSDLGCESYVSNCEQSEQGKCHLPIATRAVSDPQPLTNTSRAQDHGGLDQGPASCSSPRGRRGTSSMLDQDGVATPVAGSDGGGHEPQHEAVGEDRALGVSSVVQTTPSSGQQEESRPAPLCGARAEDHQRRLLHGGSVGAGGPPEDHRDHTPGWSGPSRVRTPQCYDISSPIRKRPELLSLGGNDRQGKPGEQRPQTTSLGEVARDQEQGGVGSGSAFSAQVQGDHQGRRQEGELPVPGRHELQRERPGPEDGGHDGHDENHAGGGGPVEGRPQDPEEDEQERGGLRDLRRELLPDGVRDGCQLEDSDMESTSPPLSGSDPKGQSASQRLSQQLSLGKARHLEEQAWSIVPKVFEGLVTSGRTILMEIACSEGSLLSKEIQNMYGCSQAATRCSIWNGCDLSNNQGVRLVLDRLELERPSHVWISPPCGPFSPLQNTNSRNEAQRTELQAKREEAMRVYVGACIVVHTCVQRGIHVTLELAERCQAWRLPVFANLQPKYSMYQAVSKGCRVNLRDKAGDLMQKGWKILTTHRRLSELLQLPCRCPKHYKHGKCEGVSAHKSELYAKEYVRKAVQGITQELAHQAFLQECQNPQSVHGCFGQGSFCTCKDVSLPQKPRKCGHCMSVEEPNVEPDSQSTELPRPCHSSEASGSSVQGKGCLLEGTGSCTSEASGCSVQGKGMFSDDWVTGGEAQEVFEVSTRDNKVDEKVQAVEDKARSFRKAKEYEAKACEELIDALFQVSASSRRGIVDQQGGKYLVFGAYSHGGCYGITRQTQKFPQTVRYFLEYLRFKGGKEFHATSLVINCNCKLGFHKDHHNLPGHMAWITAVGKYQKGELWVAQEGTIPSNDGGKRSACAQVLPNGKTQQGVKYDLRQQAVQFDPKAWHGPLPWEGQRKTVGGYVTRGWGFLSAEDARLLHDLGFPLPPPQREEACAVGQARLGRRRPLLQEEQIKRQLYQLHAATGHGSTRNLVNLLKKRNVDPLVVKLAEEFQCSVCAEKKKVQPRHLASLEALPPKFHTISTDIGHWKHPQTGEHVQFMLIIDEGSRFRTARILSKGSKQQPNAGTCLNYLREGWSQYFGMPKALRLDPAGAFRSQAVVDFCDQEGIYLDNVPADGHWQIGVCEQAIKGVKEVMEKTCMNLEEVSPEQALAISIQVFNTRDHVRGFSPLQHVFGRSPDTTGRYLDNPQRLPEEFITESATVELAKEARLRAEAEKSHAEWHAAQRISRALNSRPRPPFDFKPGDLVYFWRTQEAGQGRRAPGSKHGRFLGPARVLAMESRQTGTGEHRDASVIWCVRGRQLLKCCPEQLRHASHREELLESLSEEGGQERTPWTYTRVAAELGGNQFQDISQERPTEQEWARAQDVMEEEPPVRFRFRGKRAEPEASRQMEEDAATPSTSSRARTGLYSQLRNETSKAMVGEHWTQIVAEQAWVTTETCYWQDQAAAVEIAMDLPETTSGWNKALKDLTGYFTAALKKRTAEVSERRLSHEDLEKFQGAKSIEVKNFLAAQAFEALPTHLQPSKDQAVHMRWILTWKMQEDGSSYSSWRPTTAGEWQRET